MRLALTNRMPSFPLTLLFAAALATHGMARAADRSPLSLRQALDATSASSGAPDRATARSEVTRHFYDALVADREYAAANEQVAVTFVAFDRARAKAGAGWNSDIAIKELEVRYAIALERRQGCLARQRISRHALAAAMGSAVIPSELDEPASPAAAGPLPDYGVLEKRLKPGAGGPVRAELLRLLLDVERLRRTTLPLVDLEAELADLRVDKARLDLDSGRPAQLGAAMAGTAEAAFRRLKARAELAVALARLEELAGPPIP
jgi:hypothetical protein